MDEKGTDGVAHAEGRGTASKQKKYDVFISYRRDGGLDLARSIAYWFRANGFKCFIDQTELTTGRFNQQIYKAIDGTQYFLLLVTENALDRCCTEGDWVRREIEYARSKNVTIIPLTPFPDFGKALPAELPETLEFLRETEASQLDRQKNFESTLEAMVKRQMPLFKGRVSFSEKDKEDRLYLSIRYYKRNHGDIDAQALAVLEKEAREYGIEERLQGMISFVEEEWARECKFVQWAVGKFNLEGGKLSEANLADVQKGANSFRIAPDRQGQLVMEIEQKIRAKMANDENEKMTDRLKEVGLESDRSRRKCRVLLVLLLLSLGLTGFAWWYGRGVGDSTAAKRLGREAAQLRADVERAKQDAAAEKAAAEKVRHDAEQMIAAKEQARLAAEKRAEEVELVREKAMDGEKDTKRKLAEAMEAAVASDAARRKAEKQLSEAKEQAENQRVESLAEINRERSARNDVEADLAKKASELERANEKIQELEREKKELEKKLKEMQVEDFHNI